MDGDATPRSGFDSEPPQDADVPIRPIGPLLDPAETTLPVARLEVAARTAVISLGPLTDEELHWLLDDDPDPDLELDAPRLGVASDEARRGALEATLTLLVARGDLAVTDEVDVGTAASTADAPDGAGTVSVRAVGRHAVIAELRSAPLGMVRVRTEDRHGATSLAAVYHVTDELFLLEDVDPGGVHAFWLADPGRSTTWLARRLDPRGRATRATVAVTAASVEDLDASATADAQLLTVVDVARAERDVPRSATVTVWTLPDGVAALDATPTGADGPVELRFRHLDAAGVVELAAWCVDAVRPRGLEDRRHP